MKVDVNKIAGYADMSAEEKLKALEEYDFELPKQDDSEITKLKSALSKSNSEAAEYKRQLRERQTEEEKKEAERKEREEATEKELITLRKDKAVKELEAQYLAAGYSPELASASALAQVDGDTATVMKNQLAFIEQTKKDLEAEALKKQPTLSDGKPLTAEEIDKKEMDKLRRYAGLI